MATYQKRQPVVAVAPDGSVAGYFETPFEAIRLSGITNIYKALKKERQSAGGVMWYYRDEHERLWFENRDALKWERNPNVDYTRGGFKKGHNANIGKKHTLSKSALEIKMKCLEKARVVLIEKVYPRMSYLVRIVETGQEFPSCQACALHLGVNRTTVSRSLKKGNKINGFTIVRVDNKENQNL